MQMHERLQKAWLAEGRYRTTHRTLIFTDQGLELGKGTLLVKFIQDEWDRGTLDIEGQEERILALLSVAWDHPMPDTILQHFHSASRALSKGEMVQACLHLAYTGLQPLDHDSDNFRLLFIADGFLEAGVSGNELRKAWGLGRSNFRKFNPNHYPAGDSRGGQFAPNDGGGGGNSPTNNLRQNPMIQTVSFTTASQPQAGIDWQAISQFEGSRNDGYIPPTTPSTSPNQDHAVEPGVTIASGFDIGQHNEDELRAMGLPESIITKLRPYLDKQGEKAEQALREYGVPHLDDTEVALVNEATHRDTLNKLKARYDAAVGEGSPHFDELPPHIQTAIASVAFQWGDKFGSRGDSVSGRKFWKEIVAQDWDAAEKTLRQWGANIPAYENRRNQEADLINPDSETTAAHRAQATPHRRKQKAPLRSQPHTVRRHYPWGDLYDI